MNIFSHRRYFDEMLVLERMHRYMPDVLTGPQSEKQKREQGRTCPMPKQKNRFPKR